MSLSSYVFYGAVINPESLTLYQALPHCLLSIGPSGTIDWIVDDVPEHLLEETLVQNGCADVDIITLRTGEFLLPGFIDTHTHAPQFPNIGSGQQYELLDWLNNVTFPTEAKFGDIDFARRTYESVVRQVIDGGTTTCCYYGTLHLEATKALADIVHADGQRAFIGKCNMDRQCPPYYVESSPEFSVAETQALISHIRSLSSSNSSSSPPLVQPILTPRFAVSCSPSLLASLGDLASTDLSLHIQTHISENTSEVAFVRKLFPAAKHYADVYDSFGLLRNNTILAHAVHLEDAEVEVIKERRAGISHCPTSNFNLTSGVAPIGRYLDKGIKVGLGTDVSGGFSSSILDAIRHASIASKILAMNAGIHPNGTAATQGQFADRQLTIATLLYMATLGGAEVCDVAGTVGSFAPGKSFDALLVRDTGLYPVDDGPQQEKQALDGMLERFLFSGDDRNILRVYVQGRFIGGKVYHK